MDLIARKNFVKNHYLCFLCLSNHKLKDCPNNYLKCSICQGKHNYLLHEDSNRNSAFWLNANANCKRDADNTLIGSVGQQEISNIELNAVNTTLNSSTSVNNAKCVPFLPTAKVLLHNKEGGSFLFRALLGSGSESSFVSENAINILGLKRYNDRLFLSGISGIQAGTTRGSVGLKIGLSCLGCHPLQETGSRLSPIGHLKFLTSYLVSNGVMFHRKRIQSTLDPEASHLKTYPTTAYGGEGPQWLSTEEA
ncbi:DUF1758 domain-containing protein [Trichonephila clavipes]|uniref:DUF1758 domain-containing protein n=1 Tax=Trichonephila clavipes TaxID=2585209 RepID=A0A8X6VF40_TRICX|nr:DUF1758 domain-containing protein [Trichonephila clavipes]